MQVVEELAALRKPLTGYCYRMLASAADTDDAVQETLVRAATRIEQFDPARGSLTAWVYRIATNVCLDMLRTAKRRELLVKPASALADGELGAPLPPETWVEPMPDSRLLSSAPEERAEARESVRLAFVAALQRLTPRQRAVLVLRDVLSFSARETAEILETSPASVTSALQRARDALRAEHYDPTKLAEPRAGDQRRLLERYVAAFEAHDVAALTKLLKDDAIASMPPFAWSLQGGVRIAQLVASNDACVDDRLVPCGFNGGFGFGQYRPDHSGRLAPFALVAVEVEDGLISRIVTFLGTGDRFAEFGLPALVAAAD